MSNNSNNYNNRRNYEASQTNRTASSNNKSYSDNRNGSYSENRDKSYSNPNKKSNSQYNSNPYSGKRDNSASVSESRNYNSQTVNNSLNRTKSSDYYHSENGRNTNKQHSSQNTVQSSRSQNDRSGHRENDNRYALQTRQNDSRQPIPNDSRQGNQNRNHHAGSSNSRGSSSGHNQKKSHFKRNLIIVVVAIIAIFAIATLISVGTLKNQADDLKTEIKTAIANVKAMDPDELKISIEEINKTSAEMRESLESPVWSVISIMPIYGKDVSQAGALLDVVDEISENLLVPLARQIKKNPLDAMKVEDGFDVKIISSYLDFVKEVMPDIKSMTEKMNSISLKIKPGLVEEYAETLNSALDTFDSLEKYLDLLNVILTPNKDRTYLLVAQNSAEIRASDGFPGSVGTIKIRDGIMSIGDFRSVYDVFESDEMCNFEVTNQEVKLFGDQFAAWAHDACFNPDFGRVGEIWADSYEGKNETKVDGIISLTPAIIQELLKVCGSVTLSDGTVLDGFNATKVLQHDLYYTYVSDMDTAVYGNEIADELFAETAQKVMSLATSKLDSDNVLGYVDILLNGAQDRTILIWMKTENEEDIVEKCGLSGKLNSDPNNPVAGIYLSFADPCKLGWFLNIDTSLSEPHTKSDGRLEYDVTVKFTNTITEDETDVYEYIIGSNGGSMLNYIYFFAPADGIIYDFAASYDMYIKEDFYKDLALGYRLDVMLDPGETITVTYKVITKAGVTTPLRLENTPTLQKYRQTSFNKNDVHLN